MIPILYASTATSFSSFGIGHLPDAISPHVVEERNGEFTLDLQYPVFGEHYDDIGLRSIILAKPSPDQDPQPFRVYRITKPINGIVTISARHVRYDMEGIPVGPFTASGIQNALAAIKSHELITSPFTFSTNKTNTQAMKLETPASMLSLLGGVQGSLLDIYGGEYKYTEFVVNLLSSRGTDNGVIIRYGVDLIDLNQEENCANCYTGVLCFWRSMDGSNTVTGAIQSAGTFDYTRIKVVDRSTNYESAPTVAQLNADAVNYINNNQVGVPKVSLTLTFANLEQTEEYANIRQSIKLCDQITVSFEKIGVNTMAKVIRTDFDVINEKFLSIDIGSARTSIADTVVSLNTKVEEAPTTAEMQQAITNTTAAITGANGGAVRMLDTNGDNLPDTLYIADNPAPLLASKVWRFNYEGWGASQNGYNGPFTMGATFQQGFLAEFITAGYLSADRIKANTISVSKLTGSIQNGNWKIDLDNGTLSIGNISANNITTGTLNVDRIASNSVGINKLSGSISNNNWTIDLTNGTLTIGNISANNINTGTLNVDRIASNSVGIGKLSGSITGNNWIIDLTNGTLTIGNISADKINAGTLNAARIAANSISVSKLTGSITNGTGDGQWKIDLDNGTFTIGSISASKITSGTIDAAEITVRNLNASNITTGTLNGDLLGTNSIAGSKLKDSTVDGVKLYDGTITGTKISDSTITGTKISNSTITGSKIDSYTITGGYGGNLAASTIVGGNVESYTITGGTGGNLSAYTVEYGNTGFTGTLDQVGTNKSNIEAINGYFTGTANFNYAIIRVLQASAVTLGGHSIYYDDGYVKYNQ